jgi:hypothetical protein
MTSEQSPNSTTDTDPQTDRARPRTQQPTHVQRPYGHCRCTWVDFADEFGQGGAVLLEQAAPGRGDARAHNDARPSTPYDPIALAFGGVRVAVAGRVSDDLPPVTAGDPPVPPSSELIVIGVRPAPACVA